MNDLYKELEYMYKHSEEYEKLHYRKKLKELLLKNNKVFSYIVVKKVIF